MTRWRPALFVAAIVAIAIVAWLVLGGSNKPRTLSGYIEGDDLYLAAPVAGTVASISAVEGTRVTTGQPLFSIAPAIALRLAESGAFCGDGHSPGWDYRAVPPIAPRYDRSRRADPTGPTAGS